MDSFKAAQAIEAILSEVQADSSDAIIDDARRKVRAVFQELCNRLRTIPEVSDDDEVMSAIVEMKKGRNCSFVTQLSPLVWGRDCLITTACIRH